MYKILLNHQSERFTVIVCFRYLDVLCPYAVVSKSLEEIQIHINVIHIFVGPFFMNFKAQNIMFL